MDPLSPSSSQKYSTSRFKEHLSLTFPSFLVETSHFSPDSDHPPLHTASSTFVGSSGQDKVPRDVESISVSTARTRRETFRDRFTRIFFDIRTMDDRSREVDLISIPQRPELSEWPPLHIEKKLAQQDHAQQEKKRKSRSRIWIIVLIAILLFLLLGDLIFLNVRIAALTGKITSSGNQIQMSPSSAMLSFDANQCISQFSLSAPSDPSSYPCGSCLTSLSGASSNASAQDSQQVANALQFCALRAILDSADSNGQSSLKNGGWAADIKFCTWQGVSCDGSGMVNSL
jgi:hypothetical protein